MTSPVSTAAVTTPPVRPRTLPRVLAFVGLAVIAAVAGIVTRMQHEKVDRHVRELTRAMLTSIAAQGRGEKMSTALSPDVEEQLLTTALKDADSEARVRAMTELLNPLFKEGHARLEVVKKDEPGFAELAAVNADVRAAHTSVCVVRTEGLTEHSRGLVTRLVNGAGPKRAVAGPTATSFEILVFAD